MNAPLWPARGVLHTLPPDGLFEHARIAPSPALADRVEHHWWVRWDLRNQPSRLQETLPHPNLHLVVERGEACLWGVHRGRFSRTLQGYDAAFGIKFAVGALHSLMRHPLSLLRDRSISATPWFGAAFVPLLAQVLDGPAQALAAQAEATLMEILPAPGALATQARALVAEAAMDRTLLRAEQLAARGGLSLRAMQRLFHDYVGVSPKWVITRYRLHEAVARLQTNGHVDWSVLAHELGYFDQAHFISDFRRLIGHTPADYARRETAAAADQD